MDTSYLYSELLLAPGALLVMGLAYYFKNLSSNVAEMMTEEETRDMIETKLDVTEVEFEAIKNRLSRLESAVDRIELKIDDLLSSLPKDSD